MAALENSNNAALFKDLTTPLGGLTMAFAEDPATEGDECPIALTWLNR